MVVWLLVSLDVGHRVKKPKLFMPDGLLTAKLGVGQSFLIVILMVSLLAICERILFDLSRAFGVLNYDYFDNPQTIMVHALFIIPVLVVSVIVNILVGQHRQKYAVILMPYFATTILLTLQLITEISVYFSNHHTKAELYVVLLCIVFIASYAIWYVQKLYHQRLKDMKV